MQLVIHKLCTLPIQGGGDYPIAPPFKESELYDRLGSYQKTSFDTPTYERTCPHLLLSVPYYYPSIMFTWGIGGRIFLPVLHLKVPRTLFNFFNLIRCLCVPTAVCRLFHSVVRPL